MNAVEGSWVSLRIVPMLYGVSAPMARAAVRFGIEIAAVAGAPQKRSPEDLEGR